MRLRTPELLAARQMTAYRLAQMSGGRISQSAAYRLASGQFTSVTAATLAALCDVLEVGPGELLTRDPLPRWARRPRA